MKTRQGRPTPLQTLRAWIMFLLAPAGVYYGTKSAIEELRMAVDTFAIATWWVCLQHAAMAVFFLSIPWAYVVAWWKAVNVLWWEPPKRARPIRKRPRKPWQLTPEDLESLSTEKPPEGRG